jgi:hypothetical protein
MCQQMIFFGLRYFCVENTDGYFLAPKKVNKKHAGRDANMRQKVSLLVCIRHTQSSAWICNPAWLRGSWCFLRMLAWCLLLFIPILGEVMHVKALQAAVLCRP